MRTPWGKADHVRDIGNGILSVCTPGHGGYFVPVRLRSTMPAAARVTYAGEGWYEEDCDWALVALSFPSLFPEAALEMARTTVRKWHSPAACAAFGLEPDPESFYASLHKSDENKVLRREAAK